MAAFRLFRFVVSFYTTVTCRGKGVEGTGPEDSLEPEVVVFDPTPRTVFFKFFFLAVVGVWLLSVCRVSPKHLSSYR